jgi:hypothetical protein
MSNDDHVYSTVKATAPDTEIGLTAGQLRAFTAATARSDVPDDARIKVRVGFKGQIKSIEVAE